MYDLIEYSSNCHDTTRNLWFYYKYEVTSFTIDIANAFKFFNYKAKILGTKLTLPAPNNANENLKNVTIAIPLKYVNIFLKSLEIPLNNWKIKLELE